MISETYSTFIETPAGVIVTLIYDYYYNWWYSIIWVICGPVMNIMAMASAWDPTKLNYNRDAEGFSLSFVTNFYLDTFHYIMVWHWTRWMFWFDVADRPTDTASINTAQFFLGGLLWIWDVITLLSGVIGNTLGILF